MSDGRQIAREVIANLARDHPGLGLAPVPKDTPEERFEAWGASLDDATQEQVMLICIGVAGGAMADAARRAADGDRQSFAFLAAGGGVGTTFNEFWSLCGTALSERFPDLAAIMQETNNESNRRAS